MTTHMWDLHLTSHMWDVVQGLNPKSKIGLEVQGVANLGCKPMLNGISAIKHGVIPRLEISLKSR